MKRRDFISKIVVSGSALSLGIGCRRKIEPVSDGEEKVPVLGCGACAVVCPESCIVINPLPLN